MEKLVQKPIAMGEMLNRLQDYFATASEEELEQKFEENKQFLEVTPDHLKNLEQ